MGVAFPCISCRQPIARFVSAGWALFGGFVVTFWSVSGIIVSFIGSGWYSYIKLMEGSNRKTVPLPTTMESPTREKASA